MNIGGHQNPIFVIDTDVNLNRVYVGEGENHPGLFRKVMCLRHEDLHWLRPCFEMQAGESRRARVRIRYRQELQDALLLMREAGLFVVFDQPQRSITPGQFAAFHLTADEAPNPVDAEAPELFLSAVIDR